MLFNGNELSGGLVLTNPYMGSNVGFMGFPGSTRFIFTLGQVQRYSR